MSRIGKKPVTVAQGISILASTTSIKVTGPKGELEVPIPKGVLVKQADGALQIKSAERAASTSLIGLTRTLLQNAVTGVAEHWKKTLELVGVGYRAQTNGTELTLNLGFSHPVIIKAPKGITFQVAENKITVIGADKYTVGEIAASIRRLKPPEPYKGKGIKYTGEHIRRKVGKAGKAVGGAAAK